MKSTEPFTIYIIISTEGFHGSLRKTEIVLFSFGWHDPIQKWICVYGKQWRRIRESKGQLHLVRSIVFFPGNYQAYLFLWHENSQVPSPFQFYPKLESNLSFDSLNLHTKFETAIVFKNLLPGSFFHDHHHPHSNIFRRTCGGCSRASYRLETNVKCALKSET